MERVPSLLFFFLEMSDLGISSVTIIPPPQDRAMQQKQPRKIAKGVKSNPDKTVTHTP